MDRVIIYPDAVPLVEDLLNTNRNTLIALGLLTLDIFGSSTVVGGLPCTPTAPASLDVIVGPGRIYSLEVVDETAYSAIAADTTDDIVKQGINLESTTLSCPAPATTGTSINYLIEAMYEDQDINDVVLSYYNSSNPSAPFSGPGGDEVAQPTTRSGLVGIQVKAGIPAITGTQVTPAADAGWTALYIVTVANGQTAITAANISVYPGAPFITGALLSEPVADARYLKLAGGVLTGPVTGTSGLFASLTVNGISVQNASMLTSGLVATTQLGTGAANAGVFLCGNGTWAQVTFANVGNSIANNQVPVGAVTQWQASLAIAFAQMTGSIAAFQVPLAVVAQWQASLSIGWSQITGVKNADELQGFTATTAAVPSTVALRDGSGYLNAVYFNQASGQNENPAVSQVIVTNAADNFLRKAGLGYFINQLDPGASMAPNGFQRLPNGKILAWATVNCGDIPGNGTVSGNAFFPLTLSTIEGWGTDAQDLNGNLGSFVWNTTSVGTSFASFGAHEIVSGVVQSCQFRVFAIGTVS